MKLFITLVFIGMILIPYSSSAYVDFEFLPWQNCESQDVCKVIAPKNWSKSEIKQFNDILNQLDSSGLGHVFEHLYLTGFRSFERLKRSYELTTSRNGIVQAIPKTSTIAFTRISPHHNTIGITDRFFKANDFIDPLSGVHMQKVLLVHEVAHAYDREFKLSRNPDFLLMAGFSGNRFIKASDEELKKAHLQDLNLEVVQNKPQKALRLQREIGVKYGLPRLYSTTKPEEAFADLVAFIYFDKNAKQYIATELIQYIDTNVLRNARSR